MLFLMFTIKDNFLWVMQGNFSVKNESFKGDL